MSWGNEAPDDEPITLELMLRAIEVLQQRSEYQNQPIEQLTEPAYDLLARCNLEKERVYNSYETYHQGIARVTGFKRVKKEQVALFEQFNTDVWLSRVGPCPGPKELRAWQTGDLFPVWIAKRMAVEFRAWDANRRSELAREKNNLKKLVANPSRTKKTTCRTEKPA